MRGLQQRTGSGRWAATARRAWVVVLLAAVLAAPAWGIVRHHRVPARELGRIGNAPIFQSVGRFQGRGSSGWFSGSGVLIGRQWVLTAAHVADSDVDRLNFTIGGRNYAAEGWLAHGGFNRYRLLAGNDIAVVKLNQPVINVAPSPRTARRNEVGSTALVVGYGRTGVGTAGYNGATQLARRGGSNRVDAILGGDVLLTDMDSGHRGHSVLGPATPTRWESSAAPGDSGGGLFIRDRGRWRLAGITSFSWSLRDARADGSYSDISGYTRVSAHNPWISRAIRAYGNSAWLRYGGGPITTGSPLALSSLSAVPAPGAATAGLVLLTPLAARRRGGLGRC